jgi:DNA-binding GntR family transcriptional regulator
MLKNFNNILCNSERLLKKPAKTLEEHTGILNALRTKDPNGAKELMFYHINGGARARLSQLLHERDQTIKEDATHAES